jgi:hypothetical protein
MTLPFAVPASLPPDLARVHAYWQGLLRGEAEVPFWDDARLTDLPDLAGRLLLIDVFERPQRFRFGTIGDELGTPEAAGLFLDEIRLSWPFELLGSQCWATVELRRPTFLVHQGHEPPAAGYRRLLLPMWGEGHIGMILGAVDVG